MQGPAFEKRWADRKSRLAELDGFQFFALLRRVDTKEGEEVWRPASMLHHKFVLRKLREMMCLHCLQVDFNYMSMTLWADKKSFNAWRTGEAFKEAHGGGTLFGFVDMLVLQRSTWLLTSRRLKFYLV